MNRFRQLIEPFLKGRTVLILFLITNIVYALILLVTIPYVISFSEGHKLLDMMPTGYNAAYARSLFEGLGEAGRAAYLYRQIPVDMIYPGLFGLSYCLIIGYLLKKMDLLKGAWLGLCCLPLIAGIADYLENFGIITMLCSFPGFSDDLVYHTNIFSITKSIATTLFFSVLILLLVGLGIKRIYNNKR